MKKVRIEVLGGWLVAIAAVAAAYAIRSTRTHRSVPVEPFESTTAVAPARSVSASAEAQSPAKAETANGEPANVVASDDEPGADWELPSDEPNSPEGYLAQLNNAPADVKALGEAIMADLKKGGSNGSLELVRKASKSKNAKLQMLALMLLGNCIERARADGANDPQKVSSILAAAHDFCQSGNEMVSGTSFEMFCIAGKLDGNEANMRDCVKSALCDWAQADTQGNATLQQLIPDRYAYRQDYQYSFKADLGEWAQMLSSVIESSPNKSSVEAARELYRQLTMTQYTTQEDADSWRARRDELKAQGIRDHADDPDFDAEAWATKREDLDRPKSGNETSSCPCSIPGA